MKSETRDVVMRCVAAAAVAIVPLRAEAGVAGPPAPRSAAAQSALATPSDGARTMRRLPPNLGRGLIGVVSPDNLAGATIGYVVGRTVVRVNGRDPDRTGVALAVGPILAPHTRGLQVSGTF